MSATSKDSIFLGEVASVQSYGAFVKIPGCASQGLVHRSQISKVNVPDVSEVLAKGDRVWCKVISTDDGKIGLSMKVVDQGTGRDLDPNGVQMQLDEQRRKEWVPGGKQKTISLEAVYNTTCSKCGTRGHLGKDCFQAAGGKTYELIPEEDSNKSRPPPVNNTEILDPLKEKIERKRLKKEAKKEKKEAKKKKKAAKKLKKKLKKEAKKAQKHKTKKKKRQSSDSNSSEDTSSSSSSSESESGSEDETHFKEKAQRKDLAANSHERQTSYRRSRSRSPVREAKKHRPDSSSSRERESRETSLDRRRRTRR